MNMHSDSVVLDRSNVQQFIDRAVQLHKTNNLREAETIYRQILELEPDQPVVLHLLGVVAHQSGNSEAAVRLIKQAVALVPSYAEAFNSLGASYKNLGHFKEAVSSYRRAISVKPDFADAYFNLGNTLQALDQHEDAVESYQKAISIRPNHAESHNNLGNSYQSLNQLSKAEDSYKNAITLDSSNASAHHNLGVALGDQGKLDEAISSYQLAASFDPDNAEIKNNLGAMLKSRGELDQALVQLRKAIELDPRYAEAHNNLGVTLREQNNLEAALECFQKAVSLNPDYADAFSNYGITLQGLGRLEMAISCLEKACALDPDHHLAAKNLGLALLESGDYSSGWKLYESRWKTNATTLGWREFPQPMWDGSDIRGKTILVWGEQGIGDELVYASLYPELLKRGARCYFECAPRLVPIFQRSFPEAMIVPRLTLPASQLLDSQIDFQCPAVSLMQWLMQSLEHGTERENFLRADPDLVSRLTERYRGQKATKMVGLGWSTSHAKMKSNYDIPLDLFDSLLKIPGVKFVNLQYGDHQAELDASLERTRIPIHQDPDIDPLENMDGFAAQVAAMDLVISIVNSTAVMASGLGVPVWGLVPHVSEWRWGNDRNRCLWYPSMPLFRQPKRGDWASVMETLVPALTDWAGQKRDLS